MGSHVRDRRDGQLNSRIVMGAMFAAGLTIGLLIRHPAKPLPPAQPLRPRLLRIPPEHWPVEITAQDVDGKRHTFYFSCTGRE
jgi:hypothetical protein